jgi:putative membrane protein
MVHGLMVHAGPGLPAASLLTLVALLSAGLAYAMGVARLLRRGDSWPVARVVAAMFGVSCLAVLLAPALTESMTFPMHAVRHLLLAMVAPFAFALSAPVTLALRSCPPGVRRIILVLLHSRVVRVMTSAPIVLALDVGGMYAFYLTPLYSQAQERPWLNALVHAHMFLAGCLLSWYLVGSDPRPARTTTRARLLVLLLAAGSHDLLAKLMYAQHLPPHGGTAEQLHRGAEIMFYGGDLVGVALAVTLLSTWYARTGRQLRQAEQRAHP